MRIIGICGTHHQPFDRLVAALDALAAAEDVEVWIQHGAAAPPRRAAGAALVAREELACRIAEGDVVVCHGGPGAIWDALGMRKPTVVVPRMRSHGEHVDDHQVAFARHLGRHGWVVVVENVHDLAGAIERAVGLPAYEISSQANEAVARIAAHLDALVANNRRRCAP